MVVLTGVALGFGVYPITEPGHDVINSDWPAFATGAKIVMTNPSHLYDLDVQRRVQPRGWGWSAGRRGRVLPAGPVAGVVLTAPSLPGAPAWIAHFIAPAASTVQVTAREVALAHMAVYLPRAPQTYGLVIVSLVL